jgi:hypothetical protein
MGLRRTWVCDRCEKSKEVDPQYLPQDDRPPAGWQVIQFPRGPSVHHVLLCDECMPRLYETFILRKESQGE